MIFVLADTDSGDTLVEDQGNIMVAASVAHMFPTVQYRLMAVALPALLLASQIGLSGFNCFSVEVFKAALSGTSQRCAGFSTLWLNLALPDLPDTSHGYKAGLKEGQQVSPWLREYAFGSRLGIYGFLLSERYLGMTFREASISIARHADLLIIAAHIDGAIVVNPSSDVLESTTTIVFAIAESSAACDTVAKNGSASVSSWLAQFQSNRNRGCFAEKQRGKIVCHHPPSTIDHVHLSSLGYALQSGGGATAGNETSETAAALQGISELVPREAANSPTRNATIRRSSMRSSKSILPVQSMAASFRKQNSSLSDVSLANIFEWEKAIPDRRSSHLSLNDRLSSHLSLNGIQPDNLLEDTLENMKRCKEVAKNGGHTVIVLTKDHDRYDEQTVWEQLEILILTASLDRETAPSVVVVHDRSCLISRAAFLASHADGPKGSILASNLVSFMVGDPMMAMVLQAAGVDSCGRLVTLGPSAPPPESSGAFASSEIALDEANLILMMMIEQHLQVWGRHALPVLFDMYVPRSVVLCPISDAGKKTSKKEEQKEFLEADKKMALVEARSHPRFAAGHVLPKPCISAVYSMAYYTPGVLELLEALINPAKYEQTSAPLSVVVGESLLFAVGRPYSELTAVLLESGAIPLGLLRAPSGASGAVFPYVVTAAPNESLIVSSCDSVYVLADIKDWTPPAGIEENEVETDQDSAPLPKTKGRPMSPLLFKPPSYISRVSPSWEE